MELLIVPDWIKENFKQIVIEPSTSSWGSAIYPVAKPDKILPCGKQVEQYRLVTSFCGLNDVLSMQASPLPTLGVILSMVACADVLLFSTFANRFSKFMYIRLHDSLLPLVHPAHNFISTVFLPMGCTILTVLQRVLMSVLAEFYMLLL